MKINSRYTNGRTTFVPVAGYCNSNYCMVRTQRAGITTFSIINQRTGEFLNSGVTRDHAVKVWNRTGIYGLMLRWLNLPDEALGRVITNRV